MKSKWIVVVLFFQSVWALDPVGKVTDIQGSVTASQPSREARVLAINSPVYLKDKIITEEKAAVEVTYLDQSILQLAQKAEFLITEFHYAKTMAKNTNKSELFQGTMRFFSGNIQPNPDDYNVVTANATIGLRGTVFSAEMSKEELYVACRKGHVQIANSSGTIVIGEGMEQYAIVTSYLRRPQIFISPPRPTIRPAVTSRQ